MTTPALDGTYCSLDRYHCLCGAVLLGEPAWVAHVFGDECDAFGVQRITLRTTRGVFVTKPDALYLKVLPHGDGERTVRADELAVGDAVVWEDDQPAAAIESVEVE